mmetsp:Transcript_22071/g.21256  ORF Transcript_22071/g.21256 Transcript_22071/m.21256 type:complete len:96 (-) Transcript_22071:693-980(-)
MNKIEKHISSKHPGNEISINEKLEGFCHVVGSIQEGKLNGPTEINFEDGRKLVGGMKGNNFDGRVQYSFPDGQELIENYQEGVLHGDYEIKLKAI